MMRRVLRPNGFLLLAAVTLFAATGCSGASSPWPTSPVAAGDPIVVVGAGVAGLAAATEAAASGARVVVIDRWSVFGGNAVVSSGGITMVGTPVQQSAGVADSPATAAEDLLTWGQDADETWVQRYVGDSRRDVHDWLAAMGVEFSLVARRRGNRVARYHAVSGGGLGLVAPLFRNALALGAEFHWNEDVVELVVDDGRVVGVNTRGVRDGRERTRRAAAVILATGGFQNDLERVRASWPRDQQVPERILAGSGVNSLGSGLDLGRKVGAAFERLDHQSNDATGLPDPRFPRGERGLDVDLPQSIWVNRAGERFVDEKAGPRAALAAVLRQPGSSFWAIVDADGARAITVAGPDWRDPTRVEREILENASVVARADDLAHLAEAAGLPAASLASEVAAHNLAATTGFRIARPPFYAMHLYPLAQKSLGGLSVDANTQVLDGRRAPIPGLYAAGEVTGFAGINGRAALDGTFLGPSVMMGRIAARAAVRATAAGERGPARQVGVVPTGLPRASFADSACTRCHPLGALALDRSGWRHLAAAHQRVRADGAHCTACHSEMYPYREDAHRTDPLRLSVTCRGCHLPR